MTLPTYEVNFDGLIGPTYNFAGLGIGNLASMAHAKMISHPKEAALQGLYKMKLLADIGLKQAVLPPQERPDIWALRQLGFTGSDGQVVERAMKAAPNLLIACCASSSVWAANAATVCPSIDSADGRVHFTPANLANRFHRSLETKTTICSLMGCFAHPDTFVHHDPLPCHPDLGDEGAANHMRLCHQYADRGLHLFVFGRYGFNNDHPSPKVFPGRQTYEASQAIARLHQIADNQLVFAQQSPDLIDAGAFHNDIVAVNNQDVLIYYENCWLEQERILQELTSKYKALTQQPLTLLCILRKELPIQDLINSYLLNSQLVTLPSGEMALLAAKEVRDHPSALKVVERLLEQDNPIKKVFYFDLRESMKNGGGPACLRLRVTLTQNELEAVQKTVFLNDALYQQLVEWIHTHYRETLTQTELADPQLLLESRQALDELTQILDIGPIYPFQQE